MKPLLTKRKFFGVFPNDELLSPQSHIQNEEESLNIIVQWLKEFNFSHVPSEQVQIALKNLENFESKLLDLLVNFVRGHFHDHALSLLCYDGTKGLNDKERTLVIIENIARVKTEYEKLLHYIKLPAEKLEVYFCSLDALIQDALIGRNENGNSIKFLGNLVALSQKLMYNTSNEQFLSLIALFETLLGTGMAVTVKYVIVIVTKNSLRKYIAENFAASWKDKILNYQITFVRECIFPRLSYCCQICQLEPFLVPSESDEQLLEDLVNVTKGELLRLRVNQLFDIVKNYPESIPALEETKACIVTPEQRSFLVNNFTEAVRTKLLHPGTNTIDIISFYISMIKSFLIIETKGVLLDKVCRPTRRYLKERSDTIKYVVSGLLDDDRDNALAELADELKAAAEKKTLVNKDEAHQTTSIRAKKTARLDINSNLITDESLSWVPDPIDALPDFKRNKVGDIIESVISLFDSKNFFINEFLKHFSKQLINIEHFRTEEIVSKLELLKAKFENSTEFDSLDVMVRDIIESEEINTAIHNISPVGKEILIGNFHSTIVSYLFWPNELIESNKELQFKLPAEIQKQWEAYSLKFPLAKKGRKVKPLYGLGNVKVELELQDRTIEFNVSPDAATIIYLFNDSVASMKFDDILNVTEMDEYLAKKALIFWVKQGILDEFEKNHYRVLETEDKATVSGAANDHAFDHVAPEEKESDRFKKMEAYSPFINGMLMNLGALNVSRIQSFLVMAVPKELNYSCTEFQLKEYLDYLVDEEKLDHSDNKTYKLKA